ncbi:MAG: hypothetical protein KDC44_10265 [Phaeodactylibacter sp.]|nr:hypothetical protein [Phaeodactylibacter sp.]
MNIDQIKQKLEDEVVDNVGVGFQKIEQAIDLTNSGLRKRFKGLKATFNRMLDRQLGLTEGEQEANMSKMTSSLFEFISSLSEEELAEIPFFGQIIYKTIKVVCKEEEALNAIRSIFPTYFFPNLSYDTTGKALKLSEKVIVFYINPNKEKEQPFDPLLNYYLKESPCKVLYYGAYSKQITEVPEKAYAANSLFSIHARLQEMIQFLEYQKAYKSQQS